MMDVLVFSVAVSQRVRFLALRLKNIDLLMRIPSIIQLMFAYEFQLRYYRLGN